MNNNRLNQIKKKITCSLAGAVRVFSSVFIERGEFKLRVVSLMSKETVKLNRADQQLSMTQKHNHIPYSPRRRKSRFLIIEAIQIQFDYRHRITAV